MTYAKHQRQQNQRFTGQWSTQNTNENKTNAAQDNEVYKTPTTTKSTLHDGAMEYAKHQRQQWSMQNTNDNKISTAEDHEVCKTPTTTKSTLHMTMKYAKHQRQQNQRCTGQWEYVNYNDYNGDYNVGPNAEGIPKVGRLGVSGRYVIYNSQQNPDASTS